MAKRIAIHPIGYIAPKSKTQKDHYGETKKYVQTVRMKNGQTRAIQHYVAGYIFGGTR